MTKRIAPQDATYRQQLVRCGKPKCKRCKKGPAHGPYWFAEWKENVTVTTQKTPRSAIRTVTRQKLRTAYVGKTLPPEVAAKFASWSPTAFHNKNWSAVQAAAAKEVELRQLGARRVLDYEKSKTNIPRGLYLVVLECGHGEWKLRGRPAVLEKFKPLIASQIFCRECRSSATGDREQKKQKKPRPRKEHPTKQCLVVSAWGVRCQLKLRHEPATHSDGTRTWQPVGWRRD